MYSSIKGKKRGGLSTNELIYMAAFLAFAYVIFVVTKEILVRMSGG